MSYTTYTVRITERLLGMCISQDHEITDILDETVATGQGISVGDILVSLNDQSFSTMVQQSKFKDPTCILWDTMLPFTLTLKKKVNSEPVVPMNEIIESNTAYTPACTPASTPQNTPDAITNTDAITPKNDLHRLHDDVLVVSLKEKHADQYSIAATVATGSKNNIHDIDLHGNDIHEFKIEIQPDSDSDIPFGADSDSEHGNLGVNLSNQHTPLSVPNKLLKSSSVPDKSSANSSAKSSLRLSVRQKPRTRSMSKQSIYKLRMLSEWNPYSDRSATTSLRSKQLIGCHLVHNKSLDSSIHFDSAVFTESNGKILLVSSGPLTSGKLQWSIEIMKCDVQTQGMYPLQIRAVIGVCTWQI